MSHTNLLTPSTLHHGQSRAATPTLSRPTSSHALARPMDETLQKVLQEYVEQNLTDDEKEAFKSSSDIIEHLQEMQSNSKSLVSSSITDRVSKVLQCVKGFMGLLSAFIQQGPISSLVVGGVNCILTVGANNTYLLFVYTLGLINTLLLSSLSWDTLSSLRNSPR